MKSSLDLILKTCIAFSSCAKMWKHYLGIIWCNCNMHRDTSEFPNQLHRCFEVNSKLRLTNEMMLSSNAYQWLERYIFSNLNAKNGLLALWRTWRLLFSLDQAQFQSFAHKTLIIDIWVIIYWWHILIIYLFQMHFWRKNILEQRINRKENLFPECWGWNWDEKFIMKISVKNL